MNQSLRCTNEGCDNATRKPNQVCLKCRSDELFPSCEYFENKQKSINVNYCNYHEKTFTELDPRGSWPCDDCEIKEG